MHIGCCQDVDSKIILDKYADKPFDDRMGNTLNLTGIIINQLRISHHIETLQVSSNEETQVVLCMAGTFHTK